MTHKETPQTGATAIKEVQLPLQTGPHLLLVHFFFSFLSCAHVHAQMYVFIDTLRVLHAYMYIHMCVGERERAKERKSERARASERESKRAIERARARASE